MRSSTYDEAFMRRMMFSITVAIGTTAVPAFADEAPPLPAAHAIAPPIKAGAGSITLDEALRRAMARNPTAEVAFREIERAEALAKQVRAGWLPTLNANGAYTRLDGDRELNGRIILAQNQLQGNVQLTVPLINARQWVAHARANQNVDVARAASLDARREVAVATARAYITVITQHRVLWAAQRNLATATAHEQYATTRLGGGVGNRLDAVRASQERATSEIRVRTQLTSLARAQEALGVLVGEDGSLDAVDEPALTPPPSMESALTDAATRRTDITLERDRVQVAHRSVRDSWVDYLPVLSAVAQPFYQNPPTFSQPQTGWQAQLLLTIPLFDGGARYGVHQEREVLEQQARARLEGVLRQSRSEVRVAFESVRRADEAVVSARDAAQLARESLELAQLAYQAGATSNIEVVDAERRSAEANTAAALAEDASRQARLDLLAATGRFP